MGTEELMKELPHMMFLAVDEVRAPTMMTIMTPKAGQGIDLMAKLSTPVRPQSTRNHMSVKNTLG